jgi:hypothetical protein
VIRVCIESPLRGDYERNIRYADACMLDSLQRGEAPFLGHLQLPRVLNDAVDVDRDRGIACHVAWMLASQLVAAYTDLGITPGMMLALNRAEQMCIPREFRSLGEGWEKRFAAARRPTTEFLFAAY